MKFCIALLVVSVSCENLEFFFYRQGRVTGVSVDDYDYILNSEDFNRSIPTVLYIHGFSETQSSKSVKTIVAAYGRRNKENLLSLSWIYYCGGSYVEATGNVEKVGLYVANKIFEMDGKGFDLSKLHIVGHSLGAQLAGTIGRKLQLISGNSKVLSRITGLDPANIFFTPVQTWVTDQSLHSSDARFVDIIHTDYGLYGTTHSMGHANFFPNGGRRYQPGCPSTLFSDDEWCSHQRSWLFWSESLVGNKQFVGRKASNYFYFLAGLFTKYQLKNTALMGVDCDERWGFLLRRSNYFLVFFSFSGPEVTII